MDLNEKSELNYSMAVRYGSDLKYKQLIASRLYYSIFLKMKHILETGNFDYKRFLQSKGKAEEKIFKDIATI